jgi:ubiquinone/menaquinone biosynthesis C-methylase UbiE
MTEAIQKNYENRYSSKNSVKHIYPVEIVIRIFLGTYPNLKMDPSTFPVSKILDLGFGDGRNFPLLHNLGMNISGVEISEEIIRLVASKFEQLQIPLSLKVGSNIQLPFAGNYFDFLLACHSIYYMTHNSNFEMVSNEVARVMKTGAHLIATFPKPSSYILKNATDLGEGYMKITSDPLQIRNGSVFKVFQSTEEIRSALSINFSKFQFASCEDNFFGLQQDFWAVVCSRN